MSHPPPPPDNLVPPKVNWTAVLAAMAVGLLGILALVLYLSRDKPEPVAQGNDPNKKEPPPAIVPPEGDDLVQLQPAFPPPEKKPADHKEDHVPRILGSSLHSEPVVLGPALKPDFKPPYVKPVDPKPVDPRPTDKPPMPPPKKPPEKPPEKTLSPAEVANAAFEKRLARTEDELRQELARVPELLLLTDLEVKIFRTTQTQAKQQPGRVTTNPQLIDYAYNLRLQQTLFKKGVAAGLPLFNGPSSRLSYQTALVVQQVSTDLRSMGFVSVPGVAARVTFGGQNVNVGASTLGSSPNPKVAAFKSWCDQNGVEKFLPGLATLLQMLQVEDAPTRKLLVREMSKAKNAEGCAVLASRAMLDVSPEVRQAAIKAMKKQQPKQYLPILLRGFSYPWPAAADHAAEALVALDAKDVVPELVALLDQPDPALPVLDKKTGKRVVAEMVRINHMRNCFLCHAPSRNAQDGLVRGAVPVPGQPLPPAYYQAQTGDFARADITFLRQDFSMVVNNPSVAPWPADQRYDYMVRRRTLPKETAVKKPEAPEQSSAKEPEAQPVTADYSQRQAALYALRKLTGKDGGNSSDQWRKLLGLPSKEEMEAARKKQEEAKKKKTPAGIEPIPDK